MKKSNNIQKLFLIFFCYIQKIILTFLLKGDFYKEKICIMKMKSIMTGISIGMAVGGTMAYMKGAMMGAGAKRSMKRTIKNVEGIVGDIRYMFK